MNKIKALLITSGLLFSFLANATPVDWAADNFTIQESISRGKFYTDTLTGSFTYDVDTNTVSNVDMVFTNSKGSAFVSGIDIFKVANFNDTYISFNYYDGVNNYGNFLVNTNLPFTNDGGTLAITRVQSGGDRAFTGSLIGTQATAVPEPEAYAMMLAGLGLIGFAARRKQQ